MDNELDKALYNHLESKIGKSASIKQLIKNDLYGVVTVMPVTKNLEVKENIEDDISNDIDLDGGF